MYSGGNSRKHTALNKDNKKMEKKANMIGQMDNSDGTFESANRVYSKTYCCPTISTCGGGEYTTEGYQEIHGYTCYEKKRKRTEI